MGDSASSQNGSRERIVSARIARIAVESESRESNGGAI